MLVTEMRSRMPNPEYIGWQLYYARQEQREQLESKKAKARGG